VITDEQLRSIPDGYPVDSGFAREIAAELLRLRELEAVLIAADLQLENAWGRARQAMIHDGFWKAIALCKVKGRENA